MFFRAVKNRLVTNKTAFLAFLLFLSGGVGLNCAKVFCGEMAIPRSVYVASTRYFDFLFPQDCLETVELLKEEADEIFSKAKETYNCQSDFRTIVILSPDSDTLSVKYTASPYNRIVIFDAVSRIDSSSYTTSLLDLFAHEVGRAVSQSVRSKPMEFLSKYFLGDAFQPVGLFNVPYSFLEGAVYAQDEKSISNLLYDNWNLELLMQAKLENKFPSWLQASGAYDVYPVNQIDYIAAAAFYAYIQQQWGLEKFGEYWQECGKLNLFKLDTGIFSLVYGQELSKVWQDFIDAIPLPQKFIDEDSAEGAFFTHNFITTDYDSNYKFIVSTNYGLVWYDEFK